MQNLSRKELRLIAKNRNICGYKSIPKDKLLRIINNNERDRESLFKLKKGETKKGLYKPTKNSTFKLKREKIKKGIYRQAKKSLFESQIEEIKEILHDSIIDRDEKIDEIKKFFMIQEIIFLNKKKIIISRRELVMLLVVTTLSIKVMETKIKHYHPKIILMKLSHI